MKITNALNTALVLSLSFSLSGCFEKTNITKIGDAENILFVDDGRLLVSGGNNIYEVKRNGDKYSSQPLYLDSNNQPISCNFTGIAQYQNWIISSCVETSYILWTNNHLLAANTHQPELTFNVISSFGNDVYDQLALPNGLAFTKDGALLVADYDLLATSGIAKITLDFSGQQPSILSLEENFVGPDHGLSSPNGIRVVDNLLYVSDGNAVKRYKITTDGSIPQYVADEGVTRANETVMWQGGLATIVDDIMPLCGGVVISDYLAGKVKYIKRATDAYGNNETFSQAWSTGLLALQSPSSMAIGKPPMFSGDKLLVTEKGLLQETFSNLGNRLSTLSLPIDLNQPDRCKTIETLY